MSKITSMMKLLLAKKRRNQVIFISIAVLLFVIVTWFVVANFIFLIHNLNTAFNTEVRREQQYTSFDREAFENLHLIQDRTGE